MHILFFFVVGLATVLLTSTSCGTSDPSSICGSERPCVPEGTWVVSYEDASNVSVPVFFRDNTVRIDADSNAEVVGETVQDDECGREDPTPGSLFTSAELSNDGCTLTANIAKSWCESGEDNCDERSLTLDFCNTGSTAVAAGSMTACVCWATGDPFCDDEGGFVTVAAAATRAP